MNQGNQSDISFMTLNPETEPEILVNSDTREISVPVELFHIGVVSDDNSEMVKIRIPRYFDGNNLSQRNCTISFNNAANERGIYFVKQKEVSEKSIVIFWHITKFVTKKSGNIKFIIEFKKDVDDRGMSYSWSTLPAMLHVQPGLDDNIIIDESDLTLYQSLISMIQANEKKIEEINFKLDTIFQANIEVQNIKSQLQLLNTQIENIKNSIPYFESKLNSLEIEQKEVSV